MIECDGQWIRVSYPDDADTSYLDSLMYVTDIVPLPTDGQLLICQSCGRGQRDVSDLEPDNIFVLQLPNGELRRHVRDGWTQKLGLLSEFPAEGMDEACALSCIEELGRTASFMPFEYSLSKKGIDAQAASQFSEICEDEKAILKAMNALLTGESPWLPEEELAAGMRIWAAANPGFFESEIDPWLLFLANQFNLTDRTKVVIRRAA